MAPNPNSFDPRRTADHSASPSEPSTVDATGAYHPAESTEPTRPQSIGSPAIELPTIPGYSVESEIARGGMGRVLAGREISLDREVAIKTLLPGADAGRFITESKVTAKLPHPNIPPVYALGKLSDGSPFLVMKLIRGRTLAELLKMRDAGSISRFIPIFEQIAQAVGFAHSRGILHRDLKPANVMVGEFGEVQVMDWGLARDLLKDDRVAATRSGAPDAPADATQAGAIMGTPAYMAPEQARGEPVDARADVFALGGLLTAILTGKAVFAGSTVVETVWNAAAGNTADALARLDTCGADADIVAIAKRCLRMEPGDRPNDGRAVADLVAGYRIGVDDRLRQSETARAAAEAKALEQRKRRRVVQIGSGALATVLAIGIVGTTLGLLRANRAADAERKAKTDAEDQKTLALAAADAEKLATIEATDQKTKALEAVAAQKVANEQTKQNQAIILSIFNDLDVQKVREGTEPLEAVLAKRLIEAGKQLDGNTIGRDPVEVALLLNQLALSLHGLGHDNDAILLYQKSLAIRTAQLGPNHAHTLGSMSNLATAFQSAGQLDHALPLLVEALQRQRAEFGTDHPQTHTAMNNLASVYQALGKFDLSLPLLEKTLELRKAHLGPEHPSTLFALSNLAVGYFTSRQYARSLPLFEETLRLRKIKLGADHPETLKSQNNLASGYRALGQFARALPLIEEALLLEKARLGPDHPNTLHSMSNLATTYHAAGQLVRALPLFEEVLRLRKLKLGTDHPQTLLSMSNLAEGYKASGHYDRALPLLEETLTLRKAKLGPHHPDTLTSMSNRATGYRAAGQLAIALPLLLEVYELRKAKLGADYPDTLSSLNDLAVGRKTAGHLPEAMQLYERLREMRSKQLGVDQADTLRSLSDLAFTVRTFKDYSRAALLFQDLWAARQRVLPEGDRIRIDSQNQLGLTLLCGGQLPEAEKHLLASYYDGLKATDFPKAWLQIYVGRLYCVYTEMNNFAEAAKWRALCLPFNEQSEWWFNGSGSEMIENGRFATAEKLFRESLALRQQQQPDAWTTFDTMSQLGEALVKQKKYAEAEPILLKSYEGMTKRESKIPAADKVRRSKCLDRIVDLYTAMNETAEVKNWRAKYPPETAPKPRPGK